MRVRERNAQRPPCFNQQLSDRHLTGHYSLCDLHDPKGVRRVAREVVHVAHPHLALDVSCTSHDHVALADVHRRDLALFHRLGDGLATAREPHRPSGRHAP
eukprot:scaffold80231_cov75-Phaeocystis_antarctica.AAC.1